MTLPTLVLLPGMDGTGEMFAPFVSALGRSCNTLCVRYPGDVALGYAELEALVRYGYEQGLTRSQLSPEELFAPESLTWSEG